MNATFWVENIQSTLEIPVLASGTSTTIQVPPPNSRAPLGPTFNVKPPFAITAPRKVTVQWTQLQYIQTVMLDFNGLSWPHVSLSTLVPADTLEIPRSAWGSE